jgi:enediyne biosynthesis protein E4
MKKVLLLQTLFFLFLVHKFDFFNMIFKPNKLAIFAWVPLIFFMAAMWGCHEEKKKTLFQELLAEETGITFQNTVIQNGDNNVMNYSYYFNGGGVAVGDINNDGLADVYFSGNQVTNKLYLNKGDFEFEDITEKTGVAVPEGWKTGITMADVNQDGWLDIYVCRSAMSDSTLRENLMFINNKDLTFTERGREFGINNNSYSSHAAFFDYDKDGDLDLFVLNHSLPKYAGLSNVIVHKNQKGSKFGSKLYQNNGGKFSDVSEKAGLINNVLSFGLGVAISDLNNDGWPDLYISNDFNEDDYLYLNNQNGTFKNVIKEATGHVSLFSMGSDIADVNNDGLPDLITLDMMPASNERIKLSSGDDNYDKYQILIKGGFHHQTMRNMLQLNNGDGTFSEVGQLAGISNTDWSWASLFADFDGDGWKDLYITNGYEKDFTNMQFLKFTVDERIKARQTGIAPDVKTILDNMPSIAEGNFLFKNNRDLTFSNQTIEWGISRKYKSNGAAYADLDNDGDLDMVINTMNQPAIVYRNNSIENSKAVFLKVDLFKLNSVMNVIGTKMIVHAGGKAQHQEYSPNRGFQSCMVGPMVVGLNGNEKVDSVRIIWLDSKTQLFANISARTVLTPNHDEAKDDYTYPTSLKHLFTSATPLNWTHAPAEANDFKRQYLLPRMYSNSGPKMVSGDVDQDGLMDFYICGPQHQSGALFMQQRDGSYKIKKTAAFEADKEHQDEDAVFFDADKDGDLDLYVVSGGYAFQENDPLLQDRLYLNEGRGAFRKSTNQLPPELLAGSCVKSLDIDGDQDLDLFVGSRLVPGQYPLAPQSMFLINDGKGNFTNAIKQVTLGLENSGMVCDAIVADVNKDSRPDLIVVGEWTSIKVFINQGNTLKDETDKWFSSSTKGWWNCIVAEDFDSDGDMDFVIGNYGLNNQFNVTEDHPATLIYKDFNNDGQVDPFFCYFINGKSYPYASRDEALGQVSFLKPRFPDYTSYANATMETIFTADELKNVNTLKADLMKTVYLENTGKKFEIRDLPIQAQFAPVYTMAAWDVDDDGDKDVVMAGNETLVRARIGKSDANKGFIFLNDGKGKFAYMPQYQSGLNLGGDIRQLLFVPAKERTDLLVGEIGSKVKRYTLNGNRVPIQ